ncbi:MAG: InlB B-repeat-containing protein, partial [Clostridia bacterium]|nr:InlB B-repeat-containing protein [Clostridia bacterium]
QTDEEALEYYTNLLKTSPTSYSSTTTSVDISVTNAGDYTVYYYIPETDEYLEASGAVSGTLENLTSTVNFTLNNGYWSEGMSSNDATSVGEIGSSVSVGQVEQEGYEYTGWSEDTLSPVTLENEVKTFNGTSDYIDLGTNYKYADKLFVSIEAYMADWSQMAWSDRLISCTEGGGWNFEMTNGGDGIMFTAKDSGASYKYAKSTTKWSDLSAGWHTFVGSFDGDYLRFYIDGELKGVSENFVGQIGYNSSNSIIVGAEAGSSTGVQSTAPGYFDGKIRNVYIANTCVTASSIISHTPDDTYGYPTIYIFEDVYSWLDILAQWSANTYYIKYDAKGGTGTMSNQAVTYGATVALKTNAYSMTNFEFAGWTTSDYDLSEIPTIDYEEGAEICNLTSENGAIITLYAVWLSEYYNAQIFEMATNGSYPSTASSTKTLAARAGTTLTLADVVEAQNLVPDGFSYDYAKDASGNTITTVTVANNNATVVKFYMKRATYNLYLDGNGGDCEGAYGETYLQRYYGQAYGEDINTYFIVDRKGYTFSGWITDATGGTQVSTTTTMGIGDTTIYAHWTANTYTVTFDANGGTVSTTSETVTFDSTYGTLPTPTKPGYRFDGWTINYINVNDLVEAFEKILSIQGFTYIIS